MKPGSAPSFVLIAGLWLVALADMPSLYASEINLSAIKAIESSGCADAIGDGGKALGAFQIHKELVIDFNRLNRTNLKHSDVFNPKTAEKIASWAFNTYFPLVLKKKNPTKEELLTCYNAGCGNALKKRYAIGYISKYESILKKMGVGIAKSMGCKYENIKNLKPDSERPRDIYQINHNGGFYVQSRSER